MNAELPCVTWGCGALSNCWLEAPSGFCPSSAHCSPEKFPEGTQHLCYEETQKRCLLFRALFSLWHSSFYDLPHTLLLPPLFSAEAAARASSQGPSEPGSSGEASPPGRPIWVCMCVNRAQCGQWRATEQNKLDWHLKRGKCRNLNRTFLSPLTCLRSTAAASLAPSFLTCGPSYVRAACVQTHS